MGSSPCSSPWQAPCRHSGSLSSCLRSANRGRWAGFPGRPSSATPSSSPSAPSSSSSTRYAVSHVGLSAVRLHGRHHIQDTGGARHFLLRLHPLRNIQTLPHQLQPGSRRGQVLLPHHIRSSHGRRLPLQPQPHHRRWLRLGLHSVPRNRGHSQPVRALHQEGTSPVTQSG